MIDVVALHKNRKSIEAIESSSCSNTSLKKGHLQKMMKQLDMQEQQSFFKQEFNKYMKLINDEILSQPLSTAISYLISEQNWADRYYKKSAIEMGIDIHIGDICYIDFGKAYLYEAGYQHFGLIINICNNKAYVLPMTSNKDQYPHAYDPKDNPQGKRHLMRIGLIPGLIKPSVLFLNDLRGINTARIISVNGHIDVNSNLFREIEERLESCVFIKRNN